MIRILSISLLCLAGCTVFKPVPATTIKGNLGGHPFSLSSPKDIAITNFVFTVGTNGVMQLQIGSMTSINNSNTVSSAYAGMASVVNASGDQVNKAFENGAALTGKIIGAAAKAP